MKIETRGVLRLGVVGAGKRATAYLRSLPETVSADVKLVAVCEPQDDHLAELLDRSGMRSSDLDRYDDPAELISRANLDALILSPPNFLHARLAAQAIEAGIPTLLEKPVAVSSADCDLLLRAHSQHPETPVTVGFPLRRTAFYRAVKAVIDSGELGQVLTIEANELLGTALTKVFHDGWRRDVAQSGGFLLEKCCHDLDLLMWLAGGLPTMVHSVAGRDHFRPRPSEEKEPRFGPASGVAASLDFDSSPMRQAVDRDPYEPSNANPDHQSVMLTFDNGAICTFSVVVAQPATTRLIRIFGTKGSLQGDLASGSLVRRTARTEDDGYDESPQVIPHGPGGHYGGDQGISDEFWATVRDRSGANSSLREGIRAALVAIAAQTSATTHVPIDLAPALSSVGHDVAR